MIRPCCFTLSILLLWSCSSGDTSAQNKNKQKVIVSTRVDASNVPVKLMPGSTQRITHAGKTFDAYTVDYPTENLQLYWKDDEGHKLISIDRLKEYAKKKGETLAFATNAGIYLEDNSPQGLYIEDGKELRPLDTKKHISNANFYMQPNGVFLLTKDKGIVVTTDNYINNKGQALYATQSGPMLVIDGKINATFKKGSANNGYIRSGVGINSEGQIVFAISNTPCNFYNIASLFKDILHCNNALYLDGAIC